jgi:integrase
LNARAIQKLAEASGSRTPDRYGGCATYRQYNRANRSKPSKTTDLTRVLTHGTANPSIRSDHSCHLRKASSLICRVKKASKRVADGAENGTINRELAALKRMYRIAYDSTPRRVRDLLRFPRLKENAPRKGFVNYEVYTRLMGHVDELWLRGVLATAFTFGLRSGELLGLRAAQIDLLQWTICLDPGKTKNGEGRIIKMTRECSTYFLSAFLGKTRTIMFSPDTANRSKTFAARGGRCARNRNLENS